MNKNDEFKVRTCESENQQVVEMDVIPYYNYTEFHLCNRETGEVCAEANGFIAIHTHIQSHFPNVKKVYLYNPGEGINALLFVF